LLSGGGGWALAGRLKILANSMTSEVPARALPLCDRRLFQSPSSRLSRIGRSPVCKGPAALSVPPQLLERNGITGFLSTRGGNQKKKKKKAWSVRGAGGFESEDVCRSNTLRRQSRWRSMTFSGSAPFEFGPSAAAIGQRPNGAIATANARGGSAPGLPCQLPNAGRRPAAKIRPAVLQIFEEQKLLRFKTAPPPHPVARRPKLPTKTASRQDGAF